MYQEKEVPAQRLYFSTISPFPKVSCCDHASQKLKTNTPDMEYQAESEDKIYKLKPIDEKKHPNTTDYDLQAANNTNFLP